MEVTERFVRGILRITKETRCGEVDPIYARLSVFNLNIALGVGEENGGAVPYFTGPPQKKLSESRKISERGCHI